MNSEPEAVLLTGWALPETVVTRTPEVILRASDLTATTFQRTLRGRRYPTVVANRLGRNALCTCGSGKKYKTCCLRRDRR